jgi:riboflavin biosynthesis pyrimidine reductase
LLNCLVGFGIRSVMVEGGASVITSFLVERLVDQVALTIAPVFLGGIPALEAHPDYASERPFPLAELQEIKSMPAGSDLILWGRVK